MSAAGRSSEASAPAAAASSSSSGSSGPAREKNLSKFIPLEIVDRCVGQQIWVLLRSQHEFVGTLRGYDLATNVVLEDVTEIEYAPEGRRLGKLDKLLVNGRHIVMMVPGGDGGLKAPASN